MEPPVNQCRDMWCKVSAVFWCAEHSVSIKIFLRIEPIVVDSVDLKHYVSLRVYDSDKAAVQVIIPRDVSFLCLDIHWKVQGIVC